MPKKMIVTCLIFLVLGLAFHFGLRGCAQSEPKETSEQIQLPQPKQESEMSLEEAIMQRRSIRSYQDKPLKLETVSQLLWAANGKTGNKDHQRAAPSAGGLHPLDFYIVAGEGSVQGLEAGVWHYEPLKHSLSLVTRGDKREALMQVSLGQRQVGSAEIDLIVTIEFSRTTKKYGQRGRRYAYMDCGFACENIFLQVQTLGLAMCPIGAFNDAKVSEVLALPETHEPALLLSIGYPK